MFFKSRSSCSLSTMVPSLPNTKTSSTSSSSSQDTNDITKSFIQYMQKNQALNHKKRSANASSPSLTNGDNALHWMVRSRSDLNAVQELINTNPSLVSQPNEMKDLPLHVAIQNKASFEVIQELIKVYPESVGMANHDKMYPLHMLCDVGGSIETFQCLLQTSYGCKTVVKKDGNFRRKPLYILNARKDFQRIQNLITSLRDCRHTVGMLELELKKQLEESNDTKKCNEIKKQLAAIESRIQESSENEFWKKAKLLIQAEYLYSFHGKYLSSSSSSSSNDGNNNNNNIKMVHACAGIKNCPPSLLDFAMLLNPTELLEKDEYGNLPLHIAAMNGDTLTLSEVLSTCPQAAFVTNTIGNKTALEILLEFNSHKVTWSKHGAVQLLMNVNPLALQGLNNVVDGLYPNIFETCNKSKNYGNDMIYTLLCSKPHLVVTTQKKN